MTLFFIGADDAEETNDFVARAVLRFEVKDIDGLRKSLVNSLLTITRDDDDAMYLRQERGDPVRSELARGCRTFVSQVLRIEQLTLLEDSIANVIGDTELY